MLFSGDVKGNLDFGKSQETPLSETAMWQTLELAQSKNFIEDKEAGLDSEVAQGGTNFSGGQRQRLAIARAWLVSQKFSFLTIHSRPWTTRQIVSCAKN